MTYGYRGGLSEGKTHDYYFDCPVWDDDAPRKASSACEDEDDWWDPVQDWD